jgi:hypothetical protein
MKALLPPLLQHLRVKTGCGSEHVKVSTSLDTVSSRWEPFTLGDHQSLVSLTSIEIILLKQKVDRSQVDLLHHMARCGLRVILLDEEGIVI